MRVALRVFQTSLVVLLAIAPGIPLAAQTVDDGFNPRVQGTVRCTAIMPDGQLWVGGEFSRVGTTPVGNLARLNWNGRIAPTVALEPDGMVLCLLPLPDNTLWVGGAFTEISGVRRAGLARVTENDGARLDAGFSPEIGGEVRCLLADGDGVLVGGVFHLVNDTRRAGLVRLLADGSVDPAFDAGLAGSQGVAVNALARQPDGKVVVAGFFDAVGPQAAGNLARLHPGGKLDSTFGGSTDGEVHALGVQADGHLVIGGDFLTASGTAAAKLARLNRDGSFDRTINGIVDRVNTIAIQADGKILAGGREGTFPHTRYGSLLRLSAGLDVESSYDPLADGDVFCCTVQSDNHLLAGGAFNRVDLTSRLGLARLDSSGRTDITLGSNSRLGGEVSTIVQQPDEKLIFAGPFPSLAGVSSGGLVRTHLNGTVDNGFLRPNVGPGLLGVQVRNDRKLVVFGSMTAVNGSARTGIARLQANGPLDPAFNANVAGPAGVVVSAFADQPKDRLLLGGNFTHLGGKPMPWAGVVGTNEVLGAPILPAPTGAPVDFIAIPGEDITVAGHRADDGGQGSHRSFMSRHRSSSGTLVSGYQSHPGGKVNGICRLPDGSLLVWGHNPLGMDRNLCRVLSSGKHDPAFSPYFDGEVGSVSVQADGGMIVIGEFSTYSFGGSRRTGLSGIVHLLPDLQPDNSSHYALSISGRPRSGMIQADGKFVFWGGFIWAGSGSSRSGLARMPAEKPAVQELGIQFGEVGPKLVWTRSGSTPQVERVWFSASTDGTNYGVADEGRWIDGRWESRAFDLPVRTPLWIRAEGRVPSTNGGDAGGLVQSVRQVFLEGEIDVAVDEEGRVSGEGDGVDFGQNFQGGSPFVRTVTIRNRGNDLLALGPVVVPQGFVAGLIATEWLEPGQEVDFEISPDLSLAGEVTGELVIPSDDLDEPAFVIPLKTTNINPLRAGFTKPRAVPNRKTGLREQTLRVRNAAAVTVPAFRVILRGLPAGVEVRNATGTLPDGSFVIDHLQPLGPFETIEIKLDYFFPKRTPARTVPRVSAEVILDP